MGSIHPIFHVSILKMYMGDPFLIVPLESIGILNSLSYEEVLIKILDRQVCHLRTNDVDLIKFL